MTWYFQWSASVIDARRNHKQVLGVCSGPPPATTDCECEHLKQSIHTIFCSLENVQKFYLHRVRWMPRFPLQQAALPPPGSCESAHLNLTTGVDSRLVATTTAVWSHSLISGTRLAFQRSTFTLNKSVTPSSSISVKTFISPPLVGLRTSGGM